MLAIDTAFLQILDYPVTTGVANITRPDDAFLTETFAAKIFGNEDPLGKTLSCPGVNRILTVVGIIRMPTSKSLLSFDMVLLYPEVDYREINRQKSKFSEHYQLFPYWVSHLWSPCRWHCSLSTSIWRTLRIKRPYRGGCLRWRSPLLSPSRC
jgi:hypothetical protein